MKQQTEYEKCARRVVLVSWIAYTVLYIGKKTLQHCLPGMIAEGLCTEATGGPIASCFLAAYAAGQFLSGWLGEKVHPRYMISAGLLLAGLCNVAMGALSSLPLFMVAWGLCGLFCSMLWPPIIRAISEWTTPEIAHESGAALSVTIPVGTIGCTLLSALALRVSSWRLAFFLCGGVLVAASGIVWALFYALRHHMVPGERAADIAADAAESAGTKAPIRALLTPLLLFAAVSIVANGMIKDGLDQWIPTLLGQRFIGDQALASLLSALLPVVNIFGAYAAKWMLARGKTELGASGILFGVSAVALGAVLALLLCGAEGMIAAAAVTVLLSLSSASMLGANTLLLTYLPLQYGKVGRAATVSGALNGFSYAAAAAAAALVGLIESWEAVFLVFLAASLVGCLGGTRGGLLPNERKV